MNKINWLRKKNTFFNGSCIWCKKQRLIPVSQRDYLCSILFCFWFDELAKLPNHCLASPLRSVDSLIILLLRSMSYSPRLKLEPDPACSTWTTIKTICLPINWLVVELKLCNKYKRKSRLSRWAPGGGRWSSTSWCSGSNDVQGQIQSIERVRFSDQVGLNQFSYHKPPFEGCDQGLPSTQTFWLFSLTSELCY